MNRWIAVMTRTDHTQAMQNIVIQVYRPISYENPACYENCSQGIQLQPENSGGSRGVRRVLEHPSDFLTKRYFRSIVFLSYSDMNGDK